jgi:hypothetical protein
LSRLLRLQSADRKNSFALQLAGKHLTALVIFQYSVHLGLKVHILLRTHFHIVLIDDGYCSLKCLDCFSHFHHRICLHLPELQSWNRSQHRSRGRSFKELDSPLFCLPGAVSGSATALVIVLKIVYETPLCRVYCQIFY